MKNAKKYIVASILLSVGFLYDPATVKSFHNGSVGACNNCHLVHKSTTGTAKSLLLGSDPSSTCLNCHFGAGGANSPAVFSQDGSAMTPGGDFYWLTKDFVWAGGASPGYTHGHNITAADFGLVEDPVLTQGPGGNYQAAHMSCISCHDPHGRVKGGTRSGMQPVSVSGSYGETPAADTIAGNYRLLGDSHYDGGKAAQNYSFTADAPIARQNIDSKFGESDSSHVDYGSGMSEWCANCHAGILNNEHQVGGTGFQHPAGNNQKLETSMIDNYNAYIRTGDILGGVATTAFLQFVPFERGTFDKALLDPTSTAGPDANANVMCLTCHRAHASAFPSSGRWDFTVSLLIDSHPQAGDSGVFGNDVLYSYYGRNIATEFGADQGPFCQKCHGLNIPN